LEKCQRSTIETKEVIENGSERENDTALAEELNELEMRECEVGSAV
jgi:hypothetical protein